MDEVKLTNLITDVNAFYVMDKEQDVGFADRFEMSYKIATHLIKNGIGDITAEKHRADVAEEALEILANSFNALSLCSCKECFSDDITEQLFLLCENGEIIKYVKQQAEARLAKLRRE